MNYKHFFWMILIAGMVLLNCSSPANLKPSNDETIRLPGMPAPADSVEISEPDGLIGVKPEHTSGTFNLLDSSRVVPN